MGVTRRTFVGTAALSALAVFVSACDQSAYQEPAEHVKETIEDMQETAHETMAHSFTPTASGKIGKSVSTDKYDLTVDSWDMGHTERGMLNPHDGICVQLTITNKSGEAAMVPQLMDFALWIDGVDTYGWLFYDFYGDGQANKVNAGTEVKDGATFKFYVMEADVDINSSHEVGLDILERGNGSKKGKVVASYEWDVEV